MRRSPRALVGTLLGLALCLAHPRIGASESELPVTVLLLRHAETADSADEPRDPGLSVEGALRARGLSRLLSSAGVSRLFSSEFERTRATLQPLADRLALPIERVAAGARADQLERLAELPPGAVAVVAGHSNTIPALAAGLGVELGELEQHPRHGAVLGHDQYDRLFLVTLSRSKAVAPGVVELRYGE